MTHAARRYDLKSELEKTAAELRTLRDQIRVQLHLGRLDTVDEWKRLEPRLEAALERAKGDVSEASRKALADVSDAVRRLRQRLL